MTPFPDNAPGGEDHETYERPNLAGIIFDINDGMAHVRFLEHGTMRVNLVVRADGSLGIDPSGIPMKRIPRLPARNEPTPTPGDVEGSAEEVADQAAIPPPVRHLPKPHWEDER